MCVPSLTVSSNSFPCTAALVNVSRPPHDTFESHARYTPPRDFTRALYIPRHDSMTCHLPLYNIAESYRESIQDTVFGSYLHSVKLSYMDKPRGNDMVASVEYLVDASKKEEDVVELQVRRRSLNQSDGVKANALITSSGSPEFFLVADQRECASGPMTMSFPLEPSVRGKYRVPHPYFTWRLPGHKENLGKLVQWQIHPGPNSLFRYTLVNLDEPEILAIYIHVGIVVWLPTDFSEGVLLLSESGGQEQEAVVIASLLTMLHRLREEKSIRPSRDSSTSKLARRFVSKLRLR
ncbi:hypothetical protein BDV38DRAFT_19242 [Aspergillus pseudotamarii]|uniref:Uncharacterized protein n=1 Tax=Aspergillus pseudotamarii TaxID=132259 RepID=A0A5N6T2N2_ASPPS|nr:uncharacterized protein BDV38DRAFT_19242 [Aspergillus pseudotamarii]KAE8140565.1 hypothetical protein BDV38DRAFT_19242 [Aspergillus pseudotamarii]